MNPLFVISGLFLLLLAGFFAVSQYERHHPVTTFYEVQDEKLPCSFDGKRLVFLSDLHGARYGKENEALLNRIFSCHPDYVLMGGDMFTAHGGRCKSFSPLEELLRGLSGKVPVFYGYGNHEMRLKQEKEVYPGKYEEFLSLLNRYGVLSLSDARIRLQSAEDFVTIADVDYSKREYKAMKKAPLPEDYYKTRIGERGEDYLILLSHSPLYLEEAAAYGANLVLSGHFHGGTIRLPYLGGVMTPQYQFFYPRCRGIFKVRHTCGIVSGGLGTHTINIRFLNRPEVICITLKKEKAHGN